MAPLGEHEEAAATNARRRDSATNKMHGVSCLRPMSPFGDYWSSTLTGTTSAGVVRTQPEAGLMAGVGLNVDGGRIK
jgi:hypothetical protein